MERDRTISTLSVWSNGRKPWVQTVSVRPSFMWLSVCDRNVCRLFIKFGIAVLFPINGEAVLTLVPTGPATATLCLGQKKVYAPFRISWPIWVKFGTDIYTRPLRLYEFRESPCGGDCTLYACMELHLHSCTVQRRDILKVKNALLVLYLYYHLLFG